MTEKQKPLELDPASIPETSSYKQIVQQIALDTLKLHGQDFSKLTWLKDSPILKLSPFIQGLDHNPSLTTLNPKQTTQETSQLFDIAFEEMVKLAHLAPSLRDRAPSKVVQLGLKLIKKFLVRQNTRPSMAFENTMQTEHLRTAKGEINPGDSITQENGVHWQNIEWKHKDSDDTAKKIQLAFATSLIYFLRNQLDRSGVGFDKKQDLELLQAHIKKTYFAPSLTNPSQYQIRWDTIGQFGDAGKIFATLKEKFPAITKHSDHDPNDQTTSLDHHSAEPLFNNPDLGGPEGLNAVKVFIIDEQKQQYQVLGMKDFLSMSNQALSRRITPQLINNDTGEWKRLSELNNPTITRNIPFALRLNHDPANLNIYHYESICTNLLELTQDPVDQHDLIRWRSGHVPQDGSPRNEALNQFASLIGSDLISPQKDFVMDIRSVEEARQSHENLHKAQNLPELISALNLGQIVIGHRYDHQSLKNSINQFNKTILALREIELATFLKNSKEGEKIRRHINTRLHNMKTRIDSLLPDPKTDPQADIYKEISAILSPRLAAVDAIAVASEDTCTSATCTLPYSPDRKLVTSAADQVDLQIRTTQESLLLTTSSRVQAKLGLGWQSVISVYTQGKEMLAKFAAKILKKKILKKSIPFRQWSDLGEGKNQNWFVTALSARTPELSAGAGLSGSLITERIDLTKPDFLSSLPLPQPFSAQSLAALSSLYSSQSDQILLKKTLNFYNDQIGKVDPELPPADKLFQILQHLVTQSEAVEVAIKAKMLLTALCYEELKNIPNRANYYVNLAIQQGAPKT